MAELSPCEVLKIDKNRYHDLFKKSDFGVNLATEVANRHGYFSKPVRKTEGSSLVFSLGSTHFLKLTPPFFTESSEAEVAATKIIGNQLPFPIPKISVNGDLENWKYVITETVPGQQAKDVLKEMAPANRMTFASDIGYVIKSFNRINSVGFERDFGPWDTYLSNQLKNQKTIHLSRGNSPEWTEKICSFVDRYAADLKSLAPAKLIHADLNHEHLMLKKIDTEWRVSGVIDLADAMNAPIELEFVLPIICFFKGKTDYQKQLFTAAEYSPKFNIQNFAHIMMAIALQNRFIAFHDWFGREIKNGAQSVEEVASEVFTAL